MGTQESTILCSTIRELERAWPFSTLLDGKTLLYGIHMEMRAWGIITSSALKVSSSIPSLLLAVNPGPETWLSSPRTFSCFIRGKSDFIGEVAKQMASTTKRIYIQAIVYI